jgi:hypothetical protein
MEGDELRRMADELRARTGRGQRRCATAGPVWLRIVAAQGGAVEEMDGVSCGRGPAGAGDGASSSLPWLRIVAALGGVRGEWTGGSGGWGVRATPCLRASCSLAEVFSGDSQPDRAETPFSYEVGSA